MDHDELAAVAHKMHSNCDELMELVVVAAVINVVDDVAVNSGIVAAVAAFADKSMGNGMVIHIQMVIALAFVVDWQKLMRVGVEGAEIRQSLSKLKQKFQS